MKRAAALVFCVLWGCGGGAPARSAHGEGRGLVEPFLAAYRAEATGDALQAEKLYMTALETAAGADGNPWQIAVVEASLDALTAREVTPLAEVTEDAALAFRTAEAPPLARIHAEGPLVPGLLARAMTHLAERAGDPREAERWRVQSGCARDATVIGPLTWTAVTGISDPDPLERSDAPIEAEYAGPGPFAAAHKPVVVRGRGCAIDLSAPTGAPGVRDVVVDVDVARHETIGLALRSHGTATLRAGGKLVLSRAYELGGGEVTRLALAEATAGKLRLVARVGLDEDGESVEIDAWDEHGKPLTAHAPLPGERASARVLSAAAQGYPAPTSGRDADSERITLAAAALAEGDGRTAERLLEADATRPNAPPELALVYARALETARDLSVVHRAERLRAAYERVLEVWPGSWEAILAHAVLAGVRRGQTEARLEILKDLDERRGKAAPSAVPVVDAFDAAVSGKEGLYDRARASFERAKTGLAGTALLVDAGRFATERVGAERVAYACAPEGGHDRRAFDCYDALRARGDLEGAERELERLRNLRGGPDLYLPLSLRDALAVGNRARADRALADMLPGEVTLAAVAGVAALDGLPAAAVTPRLKAAMLTARDSPGSIAPLLRTLSEDPAAAFDAQAEQVASADRAHPILPDAATAILSHSERYEVDATGLTHALLFDVRRVSGTTDVEENAQAEPPDVNGKSSLRILRRRIFKKDGRVLEPDRAPRASQSHADLAQLEAGDIVEAVYEGWAIPGDTGDVGIDTPDMLPERTAVHEATIELRLPKAVKGALWSHPLLGKATESADGTTRVLRWTMKDAPVRRLEEGTPKMDRTVSVSFSTEPWAEVARGLRETIACLDDHEPELARWATDAVTQAKAASARAKVEAVVLAAGSAVKESSGGLLSDVGIGRANGPQSNTARTVLSNHEGSRTWLIVRALRELGIPAEVAIAENEPYSADPAFPPHVGRFMHPLAVAYVDGGAPVWIDADVPGPPLPAGHVSPELRGRAVLRQNGSISPLNAAGGSDERDEVDVRLALDEKGNAKGTFTIVLRGRDAQEIAEALFRIVGDERQRALRGVALAWVPFANVDEVALSSSEGSWQVAIRAELSIGGYAQVEGRTPETQSWVLPGIDPLHEVFPRPANATLGATYVSQGDRQNALAVSRAVLYHAHRRVELPKGATIARMPGPFEAKSDHLGAARRISVSGQVVEDDFTLSIPTGTVPAASYADFVADAHRTDDAFLASTRVRPPR